MNEIINGDVLPSLRGLPDESVDCCITSPPYYGLRDYGIDGQIGLEATPEAYVARLVEVFREVRRVLKDEGTLWLNLGDSYAGSWGNSGHRPELDNTPSTQRDKNTEYFNRGGWDARRERPPSSYKLPGIKPKDLIGIPWMVAFALRADGWYLRQDIIWEKGNPMPESVKDRCCKSHEYIFILSKRPTYYFDSIAIQEDAVGNGNKNVLQVQTESAINPIQQEQSAVGRSDGCLQNMPIRNAETLEPQIQPDRKSKRERTSLLLFGEGTESKKSLSGRIRTDRRAKREIPNGDEGARKNAEVQSTPEEIRPYTEGQSNEGPERCKILQDGKRQILEANGCNKTQLPDQNNGLHSNQGGMGCNQGQVRSPMCLLQSENTTIGNGPHKTIIEGRNAHGSEHSSILSNMQREQRKPKRTKRSVWHINTKPYKGAHFATFPEKLVEPCILAGSRMGGIVLDPFFGSGTVGVVAKKLGRSYVGIDLNPDYCKIAGNRISEVQA